MSSFGRCILAMLIGALAVFARTTGPNASATTAIGPRVTATDQPEHRRVTPPPTTTSTTVTTPPPPPTTAPTPPPAAPVAAPPPPVAPPPPPAPLPSMSDAQRAHLAFVSDIPVAWRGAITVAIELIGGSTSWGWPDGRIQVSASHLRNDGELRATITHEFGHLIAYHYGTQSPHGAPPAGWPSFSSHPNESWADCVAHAFTGLDDPSHGLPSCPPESLAWTASWLAQGPDGHPRTG